MALQLLRDHLGFGNLDRGTLLLLCDACLSAFFQGELGAMRMHLRGLKSAAEVLAESEIGDQLKERAMIAQLLLASWTLEEDVIKDAGAVWDNCQCENDFPVAAEPLLGPHQLEIDSRSTCVDLSLKLDHPWLIKTLFAHLHRNREVIKSVRCYDSLNNSSFTASSSNPSAQATVYKPLHDTLISLSVQNLTVYTSTLYPSTGDSALTVSLRSTFCLATTYARHFILDPTWFTASVFVPFHHLRSHLETLFTHMDRELGYMVHEDFVIWAFFIGACAEETVFKSKILNNDDFSRTRWFSARLIKLAEAMGYRLLVLEERERVVEDLLVRFLYDEVLGGLWEGICLKRALLEREIRRVQMLRFPGS
jgi:hypothetical protein